MMPSSHEEPTVHASLRVVPKLPQGPKHNNYASPLREPLRFQTRVQTRGPTGCVLTPVVFL